MNIDFKKLQRESRIFILEAIHHGKSSHIGSSLSCIDILIAQMKFLMSVQNTSPVESLKNIILSKGHAASAFYGLIFSACKNNSINKDNYYQDGSWLTGHISHKIDGVIHSTGSLGHGLPVASGIAYANKKKNYSVLLSDGELQEGSNWEALMVIPNLAINNISVVVDYNNQQSFGKVSDTMCIEPLEDKLKSFGWNVSKCDGHDIVELVKELNKNYNLKKPTIIIANTIKGKGVSFMEDKTEWHYNPPNDDELEKAKKEIMDKYS